MKKLENFKYINNPNKLNKKQNKKKKTSAQTFQTILLKFIRKLNMTILRGCTAKETPQQDAVTQL